ncbi:MAG: hypothetical protein QM786_12560 [Breznakibacter sp.]
MIMTKKPNIILYKDIVFPFEQANKELVLIKQDIDNRNEQRQMKSLFLYSYAVFESTLVQSYAKILYAFPERLNIEVIDFKKYKKDVISNSLSHTLIEQLSNDFSRSLSYGKIADSLKKYGDVFQISIAKTNLNSLEKLKELRNTITHNSPIQSVLKKELLVDYVCSIESVLNEINQALKLKYQEYTYTKLIKDSWNYLFNSPLLRFEDHWSFDKLGRVSNYKYDTLKKVASSLSSSERTFFILFMINYSSYLCNDVYKINDISMHVSISKRDKIAYITELFDRYPLLLQDFRSEK